MISKDQIPSLPGKKVKISRTGEVWVIISARVMRWAGLVATLQKGEEEKKLTIHNAVWDNELGMFVL